MEVVHFELRALADQHAPEVDAVSLTQTLYHALVFIVERSANRQYKVREDLGLGR